MKTCNYQGTQPRSIDNKQQRDREGLLCQMEPNARYGMKPCRKKQCHLCLSEQHNFNHSSIIPVVQFSQQQTHQFVNGYETILNCPSVYLLYIE